ncbi:hypothetical protein QWJ26_30550 [Streptomyces sp. CSDS2]|uniref:hypothetical protein n=1 Tax=Streptomyces sp. CSDS2 TaxID=3055051 RepID=UPI0025B15582|nr:hypothetical protein [Streptomyces sp. CSDS2]MDN3264078.1 hypothetical protein [Streptomyces sp. CSDS2]
MVRADTIVQVKRERQSSQYLKLVVKGGDEVHHQVRPYGAQVLGEKDGTALADGLLDAPGYRAGCSPAPFMAARHGLAGQIRPPRASRCAKPVISSPPME